MSFPNTAAHPSPTAAARVFAIPELLEEILVLLAHQAVIGCRGGSQLEPIATLSRCQAVNQDFHATIAGSKKLQSLREFADSRSTIYVGDEVENALLWLFSSQLCLRYYPGDNDDDFFLGMPSNHECRCEVYSDFSYGCDILERKAQIEEFSRTNGVEEASWRRLKLRRKEWKIVVEFQFSRNQEGLEEVGFVESDTLGRVFDSYRSLVDDAVPRYSKARR